MDGPEFDKLARKLTSFTSRRQALGGLLGAAAAVTGLGAAAEAKKNGKAKDARKGAGKGRDAKKGADKGRKPGKDQCATGCSSSGAICTNSGDCPNNTTCVGGECRTNCGVFLACPGGSTCNNPGSFTNQGTCVCSPAIGCAGAATCSATGFCTRPAAGGGGGCQTGLDRNQCGNPGTNNGVCSVCSAGQVCSPVDGRVGGSCQTRAGCGGATCQLGAICTTLNDNRVCGSYVDGNTRVCRPACPTGLVCRDAGNPVDRTCGAPLCTATSCPAGCCQEQSDFQQGIPAGCQGALSLNNRFACGGPATACRNCSIIDPNCACLNGVCTCTTTTTTTTSTTTTSTTSAPQPCGAANCTGCCDANGACQSSTRRTCGVGGQTCKDCKAQGNKKCRNGGCRKK